MLNAQEELEKKSNGVGSFLMVGRALFYPSANNDVLFEFSVRFNFMIFFPMNFNHTNFFNSFVLSFP